MSFPDLTPGPRSSAAESADASDREPLTPAQLREFDRLYLLEVATWLETSKLHDQGVGRYLKMNVGHAKFQAKELRAIASRMKS